MTNVGPSLPFQSKAFSQPFFAGKKEDIEQTLQVAARKRGADRLEASQTLINRPIVTIAGNSLTGKELLELIDQRTQERKENTPPPGIWARLTGQSPAPAPGIFSHELFDTRLSFDEGDALRDAFNQLWRASLLRVYASTNRYEINPDNTALWKN